MSDQAYRYHIWTVGCQMNVADSERLALALEGAGLQPTDDPGQADVVVLNSCSVRAAAEAKVTGKLGSLKAQKRLRPAVIIALMGCMVGKDTLPTLHHQFPHVDLFFTIKDPSPLFDTVRRRYPDLAGSSPLALEGDLASLARRAVPAPSLTRYVPIIQGCDRFCTFCVIPFRRGREESRPLDEIVTEVTQWISQGTREVTLLGQIVDRYGRDRPPGPAGTPPPDLADLLQALHALPDLWRIRFLTSYPGDLSDRIITAVATLPKVCPTINLPVQSGDDDILKAMRRDYTVQEYLHLIDKIRSQVPDVALTTDLIVGFPGESEAAFARSLELLRRVEFEQVHVAMYSERPGTYAARRLEDTVPLDEKKRRLQAVEELQKAIALRHHQALEGREVTILVDSHHKGRWSGRTPQDQIVFFDDTGDWFGRLARVRIDKGTAWSLQGTVVGDSPTA